ncbi:hypothetical protein [Algibacter sp. L4_22]|uniref:hypothetical protein n=1 Tax=Algibacter sp. L4_22 TaxID=2942477 RepID=UPI00201B49E8|nr:hypothetical protein [Algibacter sp. L4_22]MCL5127259.1 hypothetical protein [Algibacter sp. L4_22]
MNKLIILQIIALSFFSCKKKDTALRILEPKISINVDDTKYVINNVFSKGDVRRYGVLPNEDILEKRLKNIIDLASQGVVINFPKGHYKANLILKGKSNIHFIFNDAILNGYVNIIESNDIESSRIKFEGTITILDKLFIRKSNNIVFDNIIVKTDTINSLSKKKNRGVSIYAGSKKIEFNNLIIENTGGTSDNFYKYTAAALQIHGWNNNPKKITINNLHITNSDRTGLYITGEGHKIEKATITNFGLGSIKNMSGLSDTALGEEKAFAGVWINKCNNCIIDSLIVSNIKNKGTYSLNLDAGKYYEPTFINNISIKYRQSALPIKDVKLTNILVKNEF